MTVETSLDEANKWPNKRLVSNNIRDQPYETKTETASTKTKILALKTKNETKTA